MKSGLVAGREPRQRVGCRRRDRVENTEQRVGETVLIAGIPTNANAADNGRRYPGLPSTRGRDSTGQ
jgi:hypothetical protein